MGQRRGLKLASIHGNEDSCSRGSRTGLGSARNFDQGQLMTVSGGLQQDAAGEAASLAGAAARRLAERCIQAEGEFKIGL